MRAKSTALIADVRDDAISLNRLPIPAMLIDGSGVITAANPLAFQLLAPIDLIGLGLDSAFALAGASAADLSQAIRNGGQARVQLADGRILDLSSAPNKDGGTAITTFDVSTFVRDAELGSKDALTGLFNRAAFVTRLQEALDNAARTKSRIAVLCVDLDRFKNVNDTLGHPVGDALLRKVADRLRSSARKGEIIGRLGGDEFTIIQQAADQPQAAESIAARFVDLVGRTYVVSGHSINIGASVGIALSDEEADGDTLMKRADLALYKSKSSGRGQFRFFEPEMDLQMQRRRAMELDLRRALALKELELAFQPQFSVEGNSLVGFEALLRWNNPARGLVSPADFVPLAEEIGLMVPIGEWVMRTACKQAASWAQPLSVAVNVSALQFQNSKLVQTVVSALAHSRLPAERLEIEITEGVLLEDTEAVLEALRAIRELGVRISMDDFGTGYSSLSYLQKFPFHKIKIDQSFVRRMELDPESKAIVRAVAALGASLGMTTTAEGVETAEQLDLIRAEGCTHVQGYLTGRPMSSSDADLLVIQHSTQKQEMA